MELFLLRHGIPVDTVDWDGDDASRPLTEPGEAQVLRMLTRLRDLHELAVKRILASPLRRAEQTAILAAKVLGAPHELFPPLASGVGPEAVLRALAKRNLDEPVMLVGHSPDLPMLTSMLAGGTSFEHPFDRCSLARLEGRLAPGAMRLMWLKAPNQVD